MSISSILADIKHVLADLPTLRTTLVAALAAVGAVLVLLPASGTTAAVVAAVTAAGAFLSSPKVVQILNDVASAVTPAPVKAVFRRP